VDYEKQLSIIKRAWGRTQKGYCFFPWIDREEQAAAGIRRAGFYEGPAFKWPQDKDKILSHMAQHEEHDLYWCPSLFEYEQRRTDVAMDECALWADLDEINPKEIPEEYPPTVAWQTSPGRYQALWILSMGDIQGASWPGNENQRLTYFLGADLGGWDTTQLLRIPGWTNHKLEYRDKVSGASPQGKVLWTNGRTYLSDDFEDLPEVRGAGAANDLTDAVIQEIEAIEHNTVLARVKLKLTQRIRDYIRARQTSGDRSNVLWEIERSLADAGCSLAEIVSIVKSTVWNKYAGRSDEDKRLIIEANKAIAQRSTQKVEEDEVLREHAQQSVPQQADLMLKLVKPPRWLVKNILTQGGVGFIAGEPKSYKSWFGLDLAISVATGTRFLNHFDIEKPGPVLYLQEEDSPVTIKSRWGTIKRGKKQMPLSVQDGYLYLEPTQPLDDETLIKVDMNLQGGLVLSEDVWQEWLDEQLRRGFTMASDEPYRLIIVDTLMMTAGLVQENQSQEMTTKYFKPLKELARKHEVALILVHHMNKNGEAKRAGQRMLGSVANHAWAEDSMYLTPRSDGVDMETESKTWKKAKYTVNIHEKGWYPVVSPENSTRTSKSSLGSDGILEALQVLGDRAHTRALAEQLGMQWPKMRRSLTNKLEHRVAQGQLVKQQNTPQSQILWVLA